MDKTINLIKNKDLVIPFKLFENYSKLKINDQQLIILIYLINKSYLEFNPKKLSEILNINVNEILSLVNDLVKKDIISLNVQKIGNVHTEFVSLDNLYKKLAFIIVNDKKEESLNKNIFDNFEKEFGRPLTPIEFELISSWLNRTSEELILMALKEAVYNGVLKIRYIDRILYDWSKKGLKTAKEINNEARKFRNLEVTEVFNYDWLNEKNN